MEVNKFSEYLKNIQTNKIKVIALAEKACEFGWINKDNIDNKEQGGVLSLKEIKEKIEKDTLTIGVIGQMKAGKSTFLNSFIFGNDLLPAATTPMTAALSVITYGEKEKIVAEFYTQNEWEEQKTLAIRDLSEISDPLLESKIKAAKELVDKSHKLGASLSSYLGKKNEDDLSNLVEYVGADGKYVSITKSVTIYYPQDYLKGVEIVDTPGFNDPIVSREERTKAFLKKADVVLLMLYAGRAFDATDREIIFKNVSQCGIGKVIIGINKYDIVLYTDGEDEEDIKKRVSEDIKKASRESGDRILEEIIKETEPIPLSAEMALLSELPMSKITQSDTYKFAWDRHCENLDISSQKEMREKSHIDDLTNTVKDVISNEKARILFAKPINAITSVGDNLKSDIEQKVSDIDNIIKILNMPDTELEEKEHNLTKSHKRFSKKIQNLEDNFDSIFKTVVKNGSREMEDIVDSTCKRMYKIVDDKGLFTSVDTIIQKLESERLKLITRELKRKYDSICDDAKKKINNEIKDFFNDATEIVDKYLEDFDLLDSIKSIKNKVMLEMDDDLFKPDTDDNNDNVKGGGLSFMEVVGLGLFGTIASPFIFANRFLSSEKEKIKLKIEIDKWSSQFNAKAYLENIYNRKNEIVGTIKESIIVEMVEPLIEQINDIKNKKTEREQEINKNLKAREELLEKKSLTIKQIEEINRMKQEIVL